MFYHVYITVLLEKIGSSDVVTFSQFILPKEKFGSCFVDTPEEIETSTQNKGKDDRSKEIQKKI